MRTFADFKKFESYDNHKLVTEFYKPEIGLRGFIAIHNDTLGPAVGGTRMYPYKSEKQAITDVLRLSRAMTFKCALAGVSFGGGKGVILADPKKDKTDTLLRAYAEEVNKLRGIFYTGEDVGLTEDDVAVMSNFSAFFIGQKNKAGDPSPHAAYSTYIAIMAAIKEVFGTISLSDKKVVVKGVGKVGSSLVDLLVRRGAHVVIADIDPEAISRVKSKFPKIEVVSANDAHKQECDVFAPCALGDEFSINTVAELKTKIVCGAANNQLSDDAAGALLFKSNIIYVPDYLANAGGLIDVVDELNRFGYNSARVRIQIQKIAGLVHQVLERSKTSSTPTNIIADQMAKEVLENIKKNGNGFH